MLRVRVAALAVRDGTILLARHVKSGRVAYLLPGGGVEPMESAVSALERELREEAGVSCSVGALRYVIETQAPAGTRQVVQLVFDVEIHGEIGISTDRRVTGCAWHPVADLRRLRIHPDAGDQIAHDLERGSTELRYLVVPWRS